jgi:Lhr-like helicase
MIELSIGRHIKCRVQSHIYAAIKKIAPYHALATDDIPRAIRMISDKNYDIPEALRLAEKVYRQKTKRSESRTPYEFKHDCVKR